MRIQYISVTDQLLFEQFLILPSSIPVVLGESTATGNRIQILTEKSYSSIRATLKDPNIPGGVYITDDKGIALIAIASDGNIYTLDQQILLKPTSRDGALLMELRKDTGPIARVIYHVDFYYTVK